MTIRSAVERLVITAFFLLGMLTALALAEAPQFVSFPGVIEENRGQFPEQFDYGFRGQGYALLLNSSGITLCPGVPAARTARLEFLSVAGPGGARETRQLTAKSHYLVGSRDSWIRDVTHLEFVIYRDIYPGIDLRYRATGEVLEYDLIVSPHADAGQFSFRVENAQKWHLDLEGNLLIEADARKWIHRKPRVFQQGDNNQKEIECRYKIDGDTVSIELGQYDPSLALLIDPVLSYMAVMPGSGSESLPRVHVGPDGKLYVGGTTQSRDLPTQNAFQAGFQGGTFGDGFILALSPDGSEVLFLTYLGGSEADTIRAIAVDETGVYVAGDTWSTDFPIRNQFQTDKVSSDAILAKLTLDGRALVFSTYLGGSDSEYGWDLDLGPGGVFVTGATGSDDFPTRNAFQSAAKQGSWDFFLSKFSPTGALIFSTYLGGSEDDVFTLPLVETSGARVYVAGSTQSADYPLKNAIRGTAAGLDVVLSAFDANNGQLLFSTYWGGNGSDTLVALAADDAGNIHLLGNTQSSDFPIVNPLPGQRSNPSGAFVTKLNSQHSVVYSHRFQKIGFWEGSAAAAPDGGVVLGTDARLPDIDQVDPLPNDYYIGPFIALLDQAGQPVFSSIVAADGSITGVHMGPDSSIVFVGTSSRSDQLPVIDSPYPRPDQGSGYNVFLGRISLVTPTLSVQSVTAAPGDIATVPIRISGAQDVTALRFELSFDPTVLTLVEPRSATPGELFTNHSLGSTRQANRVSVLAFSSSAEPLSSSEGVLAKLHFQVAPDALGSVLSKLHILTAQVSDSSGGSQSVRTVDGEIAIISQSSAPGDCECEAVFPQVANGEFTAGNFITTLILVNKAEQKPRAQIVFTRSDGSPFDIRLTDGRTGPVFNLDIPAGGALFLQTTGQGPLGVGYARVCSTGPLEGTLIFTALTSTGKASSEAAVANSPIGNDLSLPALVEETADTGIAVANVSGLQAEVSLILSDPDGSVVETKGFDLAAGEHFALFAGEIFASLAGRPPFQGTIHILSDRPIAAVALKQEGILLTTFPVLEYIPVEVAP